MEGEVGTLHPSFVQQECPTGHVYVPPTSPIANSVVFVSVDDAFPCVGTPSSLVLRTHSDRWLHSVEQKMRMLQFLPSVPEKATRSTLKQDPEMKCLASHSTFHAHGSFTLSDLKECCRYIVNKNAIALATATATGSTTSTFQFHLKMAGTYPQIWTRIYVYLAMHSYAQRITQCIRTVAKKRVYVKTPRAVRIQSLFRKRLVQRYLRMHGPALYKSTRKAMCQNEYDFYTMEEMADIPLRQFISIADKEGCVYGFDIRSLFHLYRSQKSPKQIKNPYTNIPFPSKLTSRMHRMIRLGRILNMAPVLSDAETVESVAGALSLSPEKVLEMEWVDLCQSIHHTCGHYVEPRWWFQLSQKKLIYFEYYLNILFHTCIHPSFRTSNWRTITFSEHVLRDEVVQYFRELRPVQSDSEEVARDGEMDTSSMFINTREFPLLRAKRLVLDRLKQIVKMARTADGIHVAMNYFIMALTMVSGEARQENEWLFSVAYDSIKEYVRLMNYSKLVQVFT